MGEMVSLPAPPHDLEAEQTVLGSLLLDNSAWARVADVVAAADFYDHAHRLIFDATAALIADGSGADIITVGGRLRLGNQLEEAGGFEYLNKLAASIPSSAFISTHARTVADKARRRAQIAAADLMRSAAYAAPDADTAAHQAQEILGDIMAAARPPRSPFKLLSAEDLHAMPPQRWGVHPIFPEQGLASIFGQSGTAKSFLSLDLAAACGEGAPWFGHRTKATRVVYVALEGQAGISQRVKAWEASAGRDFPEGVTFVFDVFKLTERDHVLGLAALIDSVGGAGLIVIDTFNRATPSVDENSSQDMGLAIEAATELQTLTRSLVLLVHHTGKDATKGMRGHSSLHAAMDAAIEVSRTGDRREWKVFKSKDGQDGEAHPFRLRVVNLGQDEHGDEISSCVVDSAGEALDDDAAAPMVRLPKGGNQRIVYDALGPLFRESTARGRAGAPPVRPCLTLDEAIAGTRERLAVEPKRRNERARQAITGLIAAGVLGSNEGWLWLK